MRTSHSSLISPTLPSFQLTTVHSTLMAVTSLLAVLQRSRCAAHLIRQNPPFIALEAVLVRAVCENSAAWRLCSLAAHWRAVMSHGFRARDHLHRVMLHGYPGRYCLSTVSVLLRVIRY